MDAITIRAAVPGDINELVELENRSFDGDRISRRSFRQLLVRPTAETVVAERDGRLLGYAMILFRSGTSLARLYSLVVDGSVRNQGVGRRLLNAAEYCAYDHDRVILRLEVRDDNASAIALYTSQGYRPIGRVRNYYDDHADALRMEKLLRGAASPATKVPYYRQTTDFTCGSACLMMALAAFRPEFEMNPVNEVRLWRQATTIFMLSGPGGCEPFGLAVAVADLDLSVRIVSSQSGPLFLDTVRNLEKRRVMELAQQDFQARASEKRIAVSIRDFSMQELCAELDMGHLAVVLVSGYQMFRKKVPHWVLAFGNDGRHILVHDPWVEEDAQESVADTANLPIPHAVFDRIARYGKSGLRAAVLITGEKRSRV